MIKINKTADAPQILTIDEAIAANNLKRAYEADPDQYISRAKTSSKQIKRMNFNNEIYGDKTIKDQLILDQHGKCCFCEGKFSDNSYGDVEHYRPKSAYKKKDAKHLTYPGYYWLAYDWSNLMYSCEVCNRKYKRNEFPLNNEATRKSSHSHPNHLSDEDRLLINPIEENPNAFMTFREEVPVPLNGSLKGELSIKAYGLERLNDARLENLKAIKIALALVEIDENDINMISKAAEILGLHSAALIESVRFAKALFHSAAKDTAKFSYCVRCKFPQLPTI